MNSSVTRCSATSVTSSLCLPMSCSSRSNGPVKFASRTVKPDRSLGCGTPVGRPPSGCGRVADGRRLRVDGCGGHRDDRSRPPGYARVGAPPGYRSDSAAITSRASCR